jgi:hypothetical protein
VVNYRGVGDYDEGTRIYALPAQLPDDSFALRGTWAVDYQGVTAQSDGNAIALNYHARIVYMVVGGTGTVTVTTDGKTTTIPVSGPPNMRQLVTDDQDGAGSVQVSLPRACRRFRSRTAESGRTEGHGDAVHAVAKTGGLRTVVEHVAEVTTAALAKHLGARHSEAVVGALENGSVQRPPETRPPGAAVEFGVGGEQVQRASGTAEDATSVFVVERTAVRHLGARLAQNVVLIGAQQLLPLGVGMGDLEITCRTGRRGTSARGGPEDRGRGRACACQESPSRYVHRTRPPSKFRLWTKLRRGGAQESTRPRFVRFVGAQSR